MKALNIADVTTVEELRQTLEWYILSDMMAERDLTIVFRYGSSLIADICFRDQPIGVIYAPTVLQFMDKVTQYLKQLIGTK